MNEKMRAAERDLCARAKLTFSTGASVWAEGESVVSFTVREGADSPLLPGNVLCAEYELELANDDGQWRSGGALRGNRPLLGATAELFVRCGGEDAACGVFVVDEVRMDERGGTVRLCGGDSIGSEMAAEFRDELSYPAALSQIWAALVAQTRYEWDGELPNGAAIVDARPEWNGASLRRAAGWIAQAAGCFVRVGRAGALEVVPCRAGAEAALTADDYLTMVDGMDVYGPVTGLRVTPMGAEEAAEISDGDGEIVTVTENPLFQSGAAHLTALMRGMLDELSGLVLRRMEVNWRGDPALGVGARIALTDTFGGEHAGVITRQTLRFERGFSAECACETPDVGDAGVLRAITPEGGLNAAALVGAVDGGRLAVGSVTARAIAAGSVTAGKLAAGSVETDALAAGAVTAGKIAAGAVETDKLAAGSITAGKLAAEAVTADKLAAGAVKAEKIEAGAVDTDKLAAGAVTAEKIASGTITADRLKAKTITAESGIIDDSAIGTAQIADGSITSAKIVELNADLIQTGTLSAERLLLVGEDGVIYKINVASSGLSLTELAKDQYKNYINGTVIVAKSITAAQIAAQSITGNEILAGSITAKEINVSDLFASEATINELNAMDIRGNEYLQLYVTDKVDGISIGGRNLLRNTNQGTANWNWSMQTGGKTIEEYLDGGVRAVRMTRDATPHAGWSYISYAIGKDAYALLEPDAEYIVSMDYKPTVAAPNGISVNICTGAATDHAIQIATYDQAIPADEWTHIAVPIKMKPALPAFNDHLVYFTGFSSAVNSVHIFKNLKLEKGNKATDWSPAPEDIEGDVSALEQRMSTAEQKITADAIVSTVTSSASYKALSSTASTAKSTAETAQSTANAAKSNAANAQSTANTAKSTADTAKTKADGNATDITGLKTRMTTAESKIDQKADSITLSVLETKVDGIAVGGRNYILESGEYDPITGNGGAAQDYYIFKIADAFWSNDGRIDSNIVFSFDWEWNTGLPGAMNSLIGFRTSPYYNASFQFPAGQKTGHVSLSIDIPTLNYTATHLFIRLVNVSSSYNLTIRNAKLEVGNKATDWSPAPEDPAGSLSVNSDYSKVDINTERVRIVSKRMEVAVPSEDGEDDVLRVDADGVHAEVVEADQIVSESVVRTQGAASYTPANAGELAAILTELSGKHLTGSVSINCKNVSSGSFSIDRISGGGYVSLNSGTMNALEITNCGASVVVYLGHITFSTSGTALTISNAHEVYVDSCTFNAGIGVHLGSGWPSQAYMASCAGDCATMAQVALMSRLCICGASKPTGTVSLNYGGEVYNATPDPTFAAKASPSIPTTQTVTVSLSPTQTYTLRGTSNSDGNKLYQGRYSSSQPLRRGVMLFTLPTDLTSADKIDSATLTIRRIGGVGQGGGVSVQVRCYDVTGTLYASKTAYDGQTVSIDVTSAVKAMKTSGYTGLMLYNPDTTTVGSKSYTASYARFAGKGESGAPVLKVSYRK